MGCEPLRVVRRAAFVFAGAMISGSTFFAAADGYRPRCECRPLPGDATAFSARFAVLFFWIIVQIVEFVVLRLARASPRQYPRNNVAVSPGARYPRAMRSARLAVCRVRA